MSPQRVEKGPAARRRPKIVREAYFLYVDRAIEGANAADGPLSARYRRFFLWNSSPRSQRYSVSPRCRAVHRDRTNSKSLRRLTYLSGPSPIGSTRESARI